MTSENRTPAEYCKLLEPVLELAKVAGRRIMEVYEGGFGVRQKGDQTPVTEADLAAHEALAEGFRVLTPEVPVLSEESGPADFAERQSWRCYWLVDPLDGTREFIKRNGEFTVNIALIEGHEPVLGVIYAPVFGLLYYACRGQGAFKREAMAPPVQIRCRPWRGGKVVVAGSRSHPSAAFQHFVERLGEHEVYPLGSALKSCLVAEGKVDLYPRLGPTSEWDTAAAQCIVEEAGGQVTDTAMRPLHYNTKPSLLNPHFFVFGKTTEDWSRYL